MNKVFFYNNDIIKYVEPVYAICFKGQNRYLSLIHGPHSPGQNFTYVISNEEIENCKEVDLTDLEKIIWGVEWI